jgi:dihydrofolate synthase/folylpolyglutamate synthase
VAVEEFFGTALDADVVAEAFAAVTMPGRFEVLGHQPLVIIDGAHNPAGADTCAQVFFQDFDPPGRRILVVGALGGRDVADMLGALRADEFDLVVCVSAAVAMGCDNVEAHPSVERGCDRALEDAGAEDAVLVAGSLYVVGAARTHLRRVLP